MLFQATIDGLPSSGTIYNNQANVNYQYRDNTGVFFNLQADSNNVTIDLDPPPANFVGRLKSCKFFDRTKYCLTATWEPVYGLPVTFYNIYQNGILVESVPYSAPLVYKNCFKHKGDIGVFQVSALFEGGNESGRTTLVIIND